MFIWRCLGSQEAYLTVTLQVMCHPEPALPWRDIWQAICVPSLQVTPAHPAHCLHPGGL